jgi:hypothetical protein
MSEQELDKELSTYSSEELEELYDMALRLPDIPSTLLNKIEALLVKLKFGGRASTSLQELGVGQAGAGSGGHGVVTNLPGLPDWFATIQNTLIASKTWGKPQEDAQDLLHDFAVWYFSKRARGHLKPSLELFFRYIGRSAANRAASSQYKQDGQAVPNAGEIGAGQNYNWCAAATSAIFTQALKDKGLSVKGGITQAWFNKYKLQISAPQTHTAELRPGDQVSYVDMNTPPSGHVVTVVEAHNDEFIHVSGNAGGVQGGSVRLGQVKRETPPPNYKWGEAVKVENDPTYKAYTGPLKPSKPGIVWIASIVRLGDIDQSRIDLNDKATLDKYGLEQIPVTA